MLIIQFNDCIVKASLNKRKFEILSEPEMMVRRHIIRGYNEKIFFAETHGNAEKIFEIYFHATQKNEVLTKEIF